MPPKSSSKKNSRPIWYHCELCNIYISLKNKENHSVVCSAVGKKGTNEVNNEFLEYIQDGILHTVGVHKWKNEISELKDMPARHLNNIVFVSEGVMRIAGWRIGQHVLIECQETDMIPLIRCLWPIPEKFLTSIYVSEEDYNFHWHMHNEQKFQVRSLQPGQPKTASRVILKYDVSQCDNNHLSDKKLSSLKLKDISHMLQLEMKDFCFVINSNIHLNFFNKSLIFKVIHWQGLQNDEDILSDNLKQLSLKKQHHVVFRVTTATHINIHSLDDNLSKGESEYIDPQYSITTADIGGLNEQIQLIEEVMDVALQLNPTGKSVKASRTLLVYGPAGCGKTMICEAICHRLVDKISQTHQRPLILKINTNEIYSKFLGETEKNLASYFEQIYTHYPNPTLIIAEEVEMLCPKNESNQLVQRVAMAFMSMIDALNHRRKAERCFVLATTSNPDLLNPGLRRYGRLDLEIEIPVPTSSGRKEILDCLLSKVTSHTVLQSEIEEIAQITHGFVGADLSNLIYKASLNALKRCNNMSCICSKDIMAALTIVKPSAMREVMIECPNVRWSDIGGQSDLKHKLKQAIEWPLKYNEKFEKFGIKAPRGILMYGPPGCCKTMIAKALATESHLNFISIKGPELFSMWVGESERAVREVFRKARQVAPSIIFFDEIDAISSERCDATSGGSGSSVKERVLTQLLTELDGVVPLENVTILAATNRPDMIDKALLRPGRIDRIIYVGLPDMEARREIFKLKLNKMPVADDVNVNKLAEKTEGYSGAEIHAVCQEAVFKGLEENFDIPFISYTHFEYALRTVPPRTSPDLLRLYDEYRQRS